MRKNRDVSSFKTLPFSTQERLELFISSNIKDELFGLLEFKSEIQEEGLDLIKSVAKTHNHNKCFLSFQAYIRQAKSYFFSAQSLHYRASPLNYYYAFLNLAKALLVLRNPVQTMKKEKGKWFHGLKYKVNTKKLFSQQIKVDDGVFRDFYKFITNENLLENTNLDIQRMLSYCTDISYEYQKVTKNSPAISFGMSELAYDASANCWPILAIYYFDHFRQYKSALNDFWNFFEEVDFDQNLAREMFELHGWEWKNFSFFESKKIFNKQTTKDAINRSIEAVNKIRMSNPYKHKYTFYFSEPYRRSLQKPFNEIVAIYIVMFFLSSLVRYHPRYLEKLLSTSDLWLIERFVKNTPITFLRHITNMILGIDYIMDHR